LPFPVANWLRKNSVVKLNFNKFSLTTYPLEGIYRGVLVKEVKRNMFSVLLVIEENIKELLG
tara:strand:+ start:80 stop:265 length:186 start_codon:yes stop_codon:yes gene_type:complete